MWLTPWDFRLRVVGRGAERSLRSKRGCARPTFHGNVIPMNIAADSGPRVREGRPYKMRARAEAAEQTAERVMDAAIALWRQRPYDEITLNEIAAHAGVALSTVMRRFGSKDRLAEAVLMSDRVGTQAGRDEVPAGNVLAAVQMIVGDYELNGDAVIRMLALEERIEAVRLVVAAGRAAHEDWVIRVFGPLLSRGSRRKVGILQLVAATDVYTWKLLRRDRRMEVDEVILVTEDLCQRIIRGGAK